MKRAIADDDEDPLRILEVTGRGLIAVIVVGITIDWYDGMLMPAVIAAIMMGWASYVLFWGGHR